MRLFSRLSGDDIFISYSRKDGSLYAAGLADELTEKNFSCFIDKLGTKPDHDLPPDLIRKIKNCSILIIVGTEKAARSTFIQKEILVFKETGRTILPIDFDENVAKAIWYDDIPGLAVEPEKNPEALDKGDPSDNVIRFIEKSFNYTRRNRYMARMLRAAVALFIVLTSVGVGSFLFFGNRAATAITDADQARTAAENSKAEAVNAKSEAYTAQQEAKDAKHAANTATNTAYQEKQRADTEANRAVAQKSIADAKTVEAKKATDLAAEKARLAEIETRRAAAAQTRREKAENEARDQTRAANKSTAKTYFGIAQKLADRAPDEGLLWAQEALKTVPPGEEEAGLYKLSLLQMARGHLRKNITNMSGEMVVNEAFNPLNRTMIGDKNDKAATISRGVLKIWSLVKGQQIPLDLSGRLIPTALPPVTALHPPTTIHAPIFSPDEQYIAFISIEKPEEGGINDPQIITSLEVWDLDAGIQKINVSSQIFRKCSVSMLRFSEDGKSIFANIYHDKNDPDCIGRIVSWKVDASSDPRQPVQNAAIPNSAPRFFLSSDAGREIVIARRKNKSKEIFVHFVDITTGVDKIPPLPVGVLNHDIVIHGNKAIVTVEKEEFDENTKTRIWNQELKSVDLSSGEVSKPFVLQHSSEAFSQDNIFVIRGIGPGTVFFSKKCHSDQKCLNGVYAFDLKANRFGGSRKPVIELGDENFVQIRVSADEKVILTETTDSNDEKGTREVKIWDPKSGLSLQRPLKLRDVKVSLKDQTIVIAPREGFFVTRDIRSHQAQTVFEIPSPEMKDINWLRVSPDKKRFVTVGKTGIFPYNLVKNEVEFKPIGGNFRQVAYSEDGSGVRAVKLPFGDQQWKWDPKTGEPIPGESKPFEYRGGDVYTKDYQHVVETHRKERSFQIYKTFEKNNYSSWFHFTEANDCYLAMSLLSQADSVIPVSANQIEIHFGKDIFLLEAAGSQGAEIRDPAGVPIHLPGTSNNVRYPDIRVSPNGKTVLIKDGDTLNLMQLKSGEPIMSNIGYEFGVGFDFSADSKYFFTVNAKGHIKSWYIGEFDTLVPAWSTILAEVLTGKQIKKGYVTLIPQNEYLCRKQELIEKLKDSADSDENAFFLRDNWKTDSSFDDSNKGCEKIKK
jgi:hypothetical protein